MDIVRPPFDYELFCSLMRAAMPQCEHTEEIRKKIDARGKPRLRKQCTACGKKLSGELKYEVLGEASPATVPEWNYEKENDYLVEYLSFSFAIRSHMHRERSVEWWRQYGEYLRSPEWRARSQTCIAAAGGICSYCLTSKATQAHHVCYDRVGNELPTDLRATCYPCHAALHPDALF